MRTVYLGTSDFAVAVLERLAGGPHRPPLVVTRPDRPKGRGRKLGAAAGGRARRRRSGIELIQPEDVHAPEVRRADRGRRARRAGRVRVRRAHQGAAAVATTRSSTSTRRCCRAGAARRRSSGRSWPATRRPASSIMRLTAGLDSGPVCLARARADPAPTTTTARSPRACRSVGGDLLVRALDERPPFVEQDEAGVTYAEKIDGRATARWTRPRPPEERRPRRARAAAAHRRADAAARTASSSASGRRGARSPATTLAPAGGRVRVGRDRLLLDCNGGALELTEIQPPGGRRCAAADWLRGRPDERLTGFWLDPALPDHSLEELVPVAVREWAPGRPSGRRSWPRCAGAATRDVLDAMRELAGRETRAPAASPPTCSASSASRNGRSRRSARACSRRWPTRSPTPTVLTAIAHAFGNLGAGVRDRRAARAAQAPAPGRAGGRRALDRRPRGRARVRPR